MVDLVGFEPTTSSMPWKRAPNCATGPLKKQINIRCRPGLDKSILAYRMRLVKRHATAPDRSHSLALLRFYEN